VEGYVDNPNFASTYPPVERMALLAENVQYWKTLYWNEKHVYNLANNRIMMEQHIRRGVILTLLHDPARNGRWQFEVFQPKSRSSDSELPRKYISLPSKLKLLDFDPGQDLIVAGTLAAYDTIYSLIPVHFL
jgi:hypothetical protein